jgi:hypothetical protein
MAKDTVKAVLEKAAKDQIFRNLLISDPDKALESYIDKLTLEEVAALKATKREVLEGMVAVVAAEKNPNPWWQPASFKEAGGCLLSLVLLGLVILSLLKTYQLINIAPLTYTVGDVEKELDTFTRAKDFFSIIFPIVSALTTFWLGTAIGSQQAAQAEQHAAEAREGERVAIQQSFLSRQYANQAYGLGAFLAQSGLETEDAETKRLYEKMIQLLERAANP